VHLVTSNLSSQETGSTGVRARNDQQYSLKPDIPFGAEVPGHTPIVRTGSRSPHPHDRGKAITQHRRQERLKFGVYPYWRDAARAFPSDD